MMPPKQLGYSVYRAYIQLSDVYSSGAITLNEYCVEYERLRFAQFDK